MNANPYSPSQLGVRPAPALVNQLLAGAFGWMFAGLLLSAGVAYLVGISDNLRNLTLDLFLPIVIGEFVLALGIQALIGRMAATLALALFFAYSAMTGLTVGVIVWAYLQTEGGAGVVGSAFLSASAMFGAAAVYGRVTGRDLTRMGGILFMAVIGLVVASVVNLFLQSGPLGWLISIIGVVVFTALTAYDVQRITRGDYAAWTGSVEKASVVAALHLYLNFINLFLFMLRLLGGNRR